MKPVMLIILDGFGKYKDYPGNAVTRANTPNLDRIFSQYPHTEIKTSGLAVGLPAGQMGNSEVGHLNIGAGRVIYQSLTKITKDVEDGEFFKNEEIKKAIDNAKLNDSSLHLMGLVSKGGVHSHIMHLKALVEFAKREGLKKVYVHAITDGRDVAIDAAREDLKELDEYLKENIGSIATVSGRYYAMDRDKRWERTKKYYDAVVEGVGEASNTVEEALENAYKNELTDEFILPTVIDKNGKIKDNDSVIFFNFRPDRARQIVRSLMDHDFNDYERKLVDAYMVTLTEYDKTIPNTHIAYGENIPEMTLGEVLEKNKKRQLRIAETEKYAHVTFFFNGGREEPFVGEDRVLIPSPKVPTYDLKPEMSAYEVKDEVVKRILSREYDCIILNFANPDMVGHTGVVEAAIKAVETIDTCVGEIADALDKVGGAAIITADHGNCEEMFDENGPITSHTTNDVPLVIYGIDKNIKLEENRALCDLSPTILKLMKIEQPKEMTGKSIIKEEI